VKRNGAIRDGTRALRRLLVMTGDKPAPPAPSKQETTMTKSRTLITALALAAVTGATLSTAAFADRMGDMGGQMGGPMGGLAQIDFAAVDADKDGKITPAEVDAFRAAEVTAADTDKDGKLSAAELSAMQLARLTARAEDMAARMIERHDADGDGALTAAELATRPAPQNLFDRADTDADGALSQAELDAARAQMAEMRGGEGRGKGHGRGDGEGHGRWFWN
jgi:Ca2+-binding EF-hand superfamily protein